jgi:hypothetical protein
MILSRCCKAEVFVIHDYYACTICNLACDTISNTKSSKDYYDDTRRETETKDIIG